MFRFHSYFLCFSLLSLPAHAAGKTTCNASFTPSSGALALESITVGANRFSASLSLAGSSPLQFNLVSAATSSSNCYDPATLSGSTLNIAAVSVGSDSYNASFSLNTRSNPLSATLVSATKNSRFVPDAGMRVPNASNPFATVDSNGITHVGYQDNSDGGKEKFQSSSDGLTFSGATLVTFNNRAVDSRRTLMPDGKTWRLYRFDMAQKVLTSFVSSDGNVFTPESGIRYTPAENDKGSLGVYDAYTAKDGSVILIYLGDLMGKNNLRMARSTDGGLSFTQIQTNVLNDDAEGGGGNTFVDNKTLLLPDGRRRMVCMRALTLHSFISEDGISYTREMGTKLSAADFASVGLTLHSLHDPVLVQQKDGRYRVYVAGSTDTSISQFAIVSGVFAE